MESFTGYYRRYKNWVRKNSNFLSLLETGASSLTWLLPDRFNDNELTLEAIHTSINLISVFHEGLITGPGAVAPRGAAELTSALNALQQIEVLVELWALWNERIGSIASRYDPLIAVEGLKVLVRLAIFRASHSRILTNGGATAFDTFYPNGLRRSRGGEEGSDARAKEVFRAFAAFRDKHCLPSPQTVSDSGIENQHHNKRGTASGTGTGQEEECKHIRDQANVESKGRADAEGPIHHPHGGKTHPKTSRKADFDDDEERTGNNNHYHSGGLPPTSPLWWEARPTEDQATWNGSPSPSPSSAHGACALKDLERRTASAQAAAARLVIAGEILHILRPLVYVIALRKWGRRSWKSWLCSLAVELASARLTAVGVSASRKAATKAAKDSAVALTSLAPLYAMQGISWRRDESDELTRRKLLLVYYVLRDPFFGRFTGPAVERWHQRLGRLPLPLVGWVADKAAELLVGVQKYYTYTSGS